MEIIRVIKCKMINAYNTNRYGYIVIQNELIELIKTKINIEGTAS